LVLNVRTYQRGKCLREIRSGLGYHNKIVAEPGD
jgi:hypothetical protein